MSHENRDYIEQLHQHGFRVTMQRLMVLDAVCDIGGHATLPAISKRVEALDATIAPSTVYRALDTLVEAELVVSSDIKGVGRVYEVAEATPHHHLVCKCCGEIQVLNDALVRPLLDSIKREYDFQAELNHLTLSGLCKSCSKTAKSIATEE